MRQTPRLADCSCLPPGHIVGPSKCAVPCMGLGPSSAAKSEALRKRASNRGARRRSQNFEDNTGITLSASCACPRSTTWKRSISPRREGVWKGVHIQLGRGPYSHPNKNKDVTGSDRSPAMEAVATTRHAPDDRRDPRRKERTWRSSRIRRRSADIHRGADSKEKSRANEAGAKRLRITMLA